MRFSIPYTTGILKFLSEFEENDIKRINDIYFSDDRLSPSARQNEFTDDNWKELKEIKETFGIKLNYTLNPSIWSNDLYMNEGYERASWLFHKLKHEGCDIVTFNNTILMSVPEFYDELPKGMEIRLSTNAKIATLDQLVNCYNLTGITNYVLDRSINRNWEELDRINAWRKDKKVEITLMANEGCIPNCIWKQHCDNIITQKTVHTKEENHHLTSFHQDYLCAKLYRLEKYQTLRSPFLTPSHVKALEGKVDIIKIVGRMENFGKVKRMIRAYMFDCQNLPLIGMFATMPDSIYHNIFFSDLEEYNYSETTKNCKNKCSECKKCDSIFNDILKNKGYK